MFSVPDASILFDVVFFVVLASALIQGWSLPLVARRLGLEVPAPPEPPLTLEISSLRHVEGDIVDYTVHEDSNVAGRLVRDIALPEGVVIAIIARQDQIIPPQGNTRILPDDHAILVLRPGTRPLVNRIFGRDAAQDVKLPPSFEFPLRASTTVGELEEFYGIKMDSQAEQTLDEVMRSRLAPGDVQAGRSVRFGEIMLFIRGLTDRGSIERVGMIVLSEEKRGQNYLNDRQ
jgi:cell volume regulation protein A